MASRTHYEQLAGLFEYPERDFPARVRAIEAHIERSYPLAAAPFARFVALLPPMGREGGDELTPAERDDLQELFTRSFQVQAVTTLDVGYVAFGDDYKRAELLVNLNREHRAANVDCGAELPDHLPNVLRLLARWDDEETCEEFVDLILHPSLEKMVEEFGSRRREARDAIYKKHFKTLIVTSRQRATLYQHALRALLEIVRADFRLEERAKPEQTSDFLRNIGREMEIESRGAGHKPSVARMR